jgi:hypothetical protein
MMSLQQESAKQPLVDEQPEEGTAGSVTSTSSSSTSSNIRRLQWGEVQVRHYGRIVGDHPDVAVGPPISIDWDYEEYAPIKVNEFEHVRQLQRQHQRQRQRNAAFGDTGGLRKLSSYERRYLLQQVLNVPSQDIYAAERQVRKTQRQRGASGRESVDSFVVQARDVLQSVQRKLIRSFKK